MELLQWHKVCELGGDKLHRPPVVALRHPQIKRNNAFSRISASIYGFNIGFPVECVHSILHVSDHLSPYVAISTWDPQTHILSSLFQLDFLKIE